MVDPVMPQFLIYIYIYIYIYYISYIYISLIMWSKKVFTSTFARIMATNFSKVWIELTTTIWSRDSSIMWSRFFFAKRGISSFVKPLKVSHLLIQVTCQSLDHVIFEKLHVSTNGRSQNSAGDIKHRETRKSKVFLYHSKNINIWFISITPL